MVWVKFGENNLTIKSVGIVKEKGGLGMGGGVF